MMNREQKKQYINEMSTQLDKSEAVIVTHYQGLTVSQLDDLRKRMREHGIVFKITKNRISVNSNIKAVEDNSLTFLKKRSIG